MLNQLPEWAKILLALNLCSVSMHFINFIMVLKKNQQLRKLEEQAIAEEKIRRGKIDRLLGKRARREK